MTAATVLQAPPVLTATGIEKSYRRVARPQRRRITVPAARPLPPGDH
ncbi:MULTISPECIES: hypothetical protein [unclassified Streptomyces]|jgi:hypothetical protein|nr:hypothetical protein [Streptomyces sp. SLBN-31]TQJ92482.1 hypothetical protein FBY22_3346 [Streptomyces sp. SLBN-31]